MTYATEKQTNTYHKSPLKFPTCLALCALLCFVCMFAPLPGTNILKDRTNTSTNAINISTATPAEKIYKRSRTMEPNKRARNNLGAKNPETIIKLGKPTRRLPDSRYLDTIGTLVEAREAALPCNIRAYTDKIRTGARAQKYKSKGVA